MRQTSTLHHRVNNLYEKAACNPENICGTPVPLSHRNLQRREGVGRPCGPEASRP